MTTPAGGVRSVPVRAIDCHAHVIRRDLPLASERHSAPKRDATVEEFLGVLDAHRISHGVLTAPSFYGTDNRLLLKTLAAHSDRLRGTAIVAADTGPETLAEMASSGVVGIRLNWLRRDALPDVAGPDYRRLLEYVRAQRWQVEIYLEGPKLAFVLPRLRDAGVRVVVDHFGSPDPTRGVSCAGFGEVLKGVRAGDTWVKLSAPYRLGGADPQRYVDALLATGGASQLVWASDWPFVGYEEAVTYQQCIDWLVAWIPDEAARRTVLVDTPSSLFGFAPAPHRN
jgi:predicted TIM-barrel fold metal-dependent hydrolase